jgi:hypothetical protein
MGFVTATVPTRIDEDKLVVLTQRLNIAALSTSSLLFGASFYPKRLPTVSLTQMI